MMNYCFFIFKVCFKEEAGPRKRDFQSKGACPKNFEVPLYIGEGAPALSQRPSPKRPAQGKEISKAKGLVEKVDGSIFLSWTCLHPYQHFDSDIVHFVDHMGSGVSSLSCLIHTEVTAPLAFSAFSFSSPSAYMTLWSLWNSHARHSPDDRNHTVQKCAVCSFQTKASQKILKVSNPCVRICKLVVSHQLLVGKNVAGKTGEVPSKKSL